MKTQTQRETHSYTETTRTHKPVQAKSQGRMHGYKNNRKPCNEQSAFLRLIPPPRPLKKYNPTLAGSRETAEAWIKVSSVIFRWWVQSPSDKTPLLVSVLLRLSESMGGDGRTSSHSSSWVSRSLDCLHWVTACVTSQTPVFSFITYWYTSQADCQVKRPCRRVLRGELVWFQACLKTTVYCGTQVLFQKIS